MSKMSLMITWRWKCLILSTLKASFRVEISSPCFMSWKLSLHHCIVYYFNIHFQKQSGIILHIMQKCIISKWGYQIAFSTKKCFSIIKTHSGGWSLWIVEGQNCIWGCFDRVYCNLPDAPENNFQKNIIH